MNLSKPNWKLLAGQAVAVVWDLVLGEEPRRHVYMRHLQKYGRLIDVTIV